ncbi:MAG: SDR family oxidoreductase [Myxococcota bacterium]
MTSPEQEPREPHAHRRVLITGAAGGVGAALARELAAGGARLALVDAETDAEGRPLAEGDGRLGTLARDLGPAVVFSARRDAGEAEAFVAEAAEALGGLDGAVACAGHRRDRSLLRLQDQDLADALAGPLVGAVRLTRAVARHLSEARRPGSVVLSTSPSAFFGVARQSHHAAAAAGVVAFVRSAALELRRQDIRVNAVAPTARSRLTEDLPLFQRVRPGSLGPEHPARLMAYLLSEQAGGVHGETLGVAGGRVYALQARESTGAFASPGPFGYVELGERWDEIVA